MNPEVPAHKTGTIGELLVKIILNSLNVNTGNVDKDTGTDIVMFHNNTIRTAQVKTSLNKWRLGKIRNVHVVFMVRLKWINEPPALPNYKIKWKLRGHNIWQNSLDQSSLSDMFDTFTNQSHQGIA